MLERLVTIRAEAELMHLLRVVLRELHPDLEETRLQWYQEKFQTSITELRGATHEDQVLSLYGELKDKVETEVLTVRELTWRDVMSAVSKRLTYQENISLLMAASTVFPLKRTRHVTPTSVLRPRKPYSRRSSRSARP